MAAFIKQGPAQWRLGMAIIPLGHGQEFNAVLRGYVVQERKRTLRAFAYEVEQYCLLH